MAAAVEEFWTFTTNSINAMATFLWGIFPFSGRFCGFISIFSLLAFLCLAFRGRVIGEHVRSLNRTKVLPFISLISYIDLTRFLSKSHKILQKPCKKTRSLKILQDSYPYLTRSCKILNRILQNIVKFLFQTDGVRFDFVPQGSWEIRKNLEWTIIRCFFLNVPIIISGIWPTTVHDQITYYHWFMSPVDQSLLSKL